MITVIKYWCYNFYYIAVVSVLCFSFLNHTAVVKLTLYSLEFVIIFITLMCNFDFCYSKDSYKVVLGDYDRTVQEGGEQFIKVSAFETVRVTEFQW